jgi:energy-coupling factor transport system permease protein
MNFGQDRFFERFHAGALLTYSLGLMVLAVWAQHPLVLLLLLAVGLLVLTASGGGRVLWRLMKFGWPLLLLVVVLNVLVNKNGATVLWQGPRVLVFGELRVTLEALAYSSVMVVRLVVFLLSSALYLTWMSPDRALGLFARFARRSAVTAMLTARLVPYLAEQVQSAREVFRTRGVRFGEGN